jgi:very-short-patch-repair endonuclease
MTINYVIALAALFIAFVLIGATARKKQLPSKKLPAAKPKIPLSINEQPMYFRLKEAFPDDVVLAQVSFSALLQSPNQATRNQYNRKMADFVLCTKSFEVIAVVELDDSSHKGREEKDMDRDRLLTNAGYRVKRYKTVPNIETLKTEIAKEKNYNWRDSATVSH